MKLCNLCEHTMDSTPDNYWWCEHCDTEDCHRPKHRCGQCVSAARTDYDYFDADLPDVPQEPDDWQPPIEELYPGDDHEPGYIQGFIIIVEPPDDDD